MANARIKYVSRGKHLDPASNTIVDDDYLLVHVITDEDQEAVFNLYFADHAGLEAEWNAGTAVTVLDAAVDSWVGATMSTADDELDGGGQRSGKEGYVYAIP